jgi:oligoendopeptidase F
VASNFNQVMVRAHLLSTTKNPEFQIAVMEEAMSNFHRYFFLMPTLARFELEIHERVERGEALTAQSLMTLMTELFREGYGDEMVIYVYQYATGIAGAHALAKRVLENIPGATAQYLSFLKTGSALYPLDALKQAGVDLTSPEPVEQAFTVLNQMVDQLESLLKQREEEGQNQRAKTR